METFDRILASEELAKFGITVQYLDEIAAQFQSCYGRFLEEPRMKRAEASKGIRFFCVGALNQVHRRNGFGVDNDPVNTQHWLTDGSARIDFHMGSCDVDVVHVNTTLGAEFDDFVADGNESLFDDYPRRECPEGRFVYVFQALHGSLYRGYKVFLAHIRGFDSNNKSQILIRKRYLIDVVSPS